MWIQKEINLRPRERGFHLITEEVERSIREIRQIRAGLLNIFIKHTSASLTINEN
ncbi:YjbQ family protein, partial [Escherichia coli]|nr:YjbQ family protein [Escherichia coli]